jgi:hypothetical protein
MSYGTDYEEGVIIAFNADGIVVKNKWDCIMRLPYDIIERIEEA